MIYKKMISKLEGIARRNGIAFIDTISIYSKYNSKVKSEDKSLELTERYFNIFGGKYK